MASRSDARVGRLGTRESGRRLGEGCQKQAGDSNADAVPCSERFLRLLQGDDNGDSEVAVNDLAKHNIVELTNEQVQRERERDSGGEQTTVGRLEIGRWGLLVGDCFII